MFHHSAELSTPRSDGFELSVCRLFRHHGDDDDDDDDNDNEDGLMLNRKVTIKLPLCMV